MALKVVLDPEDWKKILIHITRYPVPFQDVDKAAEVKAAIQKAETMDVNIQEKITTKI